MIKKIISLFLLIMTLPSVFPEESGGKKQKSFVSLLSLAVNSGIEYPVGVTADLLGPGIPVTLNAGLPLQRLPWLSINADISYSFLTMNVDASISQFNAGIGPGFNLELHPRWILSLSSKAGGYYGFFNQAVYDPDENPYPILNGGSFYFSAGCGLEFYLSPLYSMGLRVSSFNYYYGTMDRGKDIVFFHTIRGGLGGSFHFNGLKRRITLDSIQFAGIFPANYKYYERRHAGTCIIRNNERFPISDISISVFVPPFTENPTKIYSPGNLYAGKDRSIGLKIVFADNVLGLTESKVVNAELIMEYSLNGKNRQYKTSVPLQLHSRNAITWDNAKKAASFITTTDTAILSIVKPVAGIAGTTGPVLPDKNLKTAIALFSTLSLYDIQYVSDPKTILYKDASENADIIDFLQFPVQTLSFKAGDCDDLTILFCTLLESVGIETAFISVPGHILPAFRTTLNRSDSKCCFFNIDDFIITEDGSIWIPVEITLIGNSFQEAWESGARKWREFDTYGNAQLFSVHDSWKTFEAVDSPATGSPIPIISEGMIKEKYTGDLNIFITNQVDTKIEELKNKIEEKENRENILNQMGICYAIYGFYDKAESIFLTLIKEYESYDATVNLGNLYYIKRMYDKALEQYKKAKEMDPSKTLEIKERENITSRNSEKQAQGNAGIEDPYEKINKLEWMYEDE